MQTEAAKPDAIDHLDALLNALAELTIGDMRDSPRVEDVCHAYLAFLAKQDA